MSLKPVQLLDDLIERSGANVVIDKAFSFLTGEESVSGELRRGAGPEQLAGYLPYRCFHPDDEIYENTNTLGWVIEVTPLTGSDESIESVLSGIFEEGIPESVSVQVSSYASPYVGEILETWADVRVRRGGVFEEIARNRIDHFRKMIWESGSRHGPYHTRDFRCFISVAIAKESVKQIAFDNLKALREQIRSTLRTLNVASIVLGPEELLSLVSGWMNMDGSPTNHEIPYEEDRDLSLQATRADTNLIVRPAELDVSTVGYGVKSYREGALSARIPVRKNTQIRTYQAKRLPRQAGQPVMSALLGDFVQDQLRLSGAVWLTLSLTYKSPEQSQREAGYKSIRSDRHKNTFVARMYPSVVRKAADWSMVNDEVQNGARLVDYTFGAMLQAPQGEIDKAEMSLRSICRVRGFEMEANDGAHLPAMLSHLPMGFGDGFGQDLGRMRFLRTGLSRTMPALAPLQGQPKGGSIPHMLLTTRLGQPLWWSPFQNASEGNHNVTVTGASGSGKSVLMQGVAGEALALGMQVSVLDDGHSFASLCKLLGGEHVVFRRERALCMNPFSLVDPKSANDEDEAMAARNSILQILNLMARGEQGGTRQELGILDHAVSIIWESKGRKGNVVDVHDALLGIGGPVAVSLAEGMKAFAVGTYADFFNGPASLDTQNPFTVYELSDLEPMKELRQVVILALLFQIRQRMKVGGRSQRKLVIVDEAWQMLGDGPAGEFIDGFARRARKEGGSLITGTQSIDDYYKTSGAQAAFANSDWNIVLRTKPEQADALLNNDRLGLDEGGVRALKTLRLSAEEYSELMILGPQTRLVGRLTLDRFSSALYSSSPEVFTRIQRRQQSGMSLLEALHVEAGDA